LDTAHKNEQGYKQTPVKWQAVDAVWLKAL